MPRANGALIKNGKSGAAWGVWPRGRVAVILLASCCVCHKANRDGCGCAFCSLLNHNRCRCPSHRRACYGCGLRCAAGIAAPDVSDVSPSGRWNRRQCYRCPCNHLKPGIGCYGNREAREHHGVGIRCDVRPSVHLNCYSVVSGGISRELHKWPGSTSAPHMGCRSLISCCSRYRKS